MALIEAQKESKKDVNTRTAQLVQLLTEIGPDIPEISRRLGQFKESVRYRYKEKIVNRGFAVQAAVDHEKFGLRRVIFVVDFAPQYKTKMRSEEHTSELQSRPHLVCRLLLEKKKNR